MAAGKPNYGDWMRQIEQDFDTRFPNVPYDEWRRAMQLSNQSIFGQQKQNIFGDMSRAGITSPGFRQSMLNPAYQQLYGANVQGEAQIGMAKSQAQLEWERARALAKMNIWGMTNQGMMANQPTDWWETLLGLGSVGASAYGAGAFGGGGSAAAVPSA